MKRTFLALSVTIILIVLGSFYSNESIAHVPLDEPDYCWCHIPGSQIPISIGGYCSEGGEGCIPNCCPGNTVGCCDQA